MKILLLLSGLVLTCWFPVAEARTDVNEVREAAAEGEVEVNNLAGEIRVQGWDKNRIEVSGYLGDGVERLDIVQDGKHTLIKVVYPKNSRNVKGSKLDVRLPQASDLSVNGVSADISASGVTGVQRLQTVSGDVETDVSGSDVEIKAVSGDLEVTGSELPALLTLTTVSGDADVRKIAGELEMSTVSGDLDVHAGILSRARVKTTNGDITLVGLLDEGGRMEAKTINGDVEVSLEEPENLSVEIETFNGDIETCFDAEIQRKNKYGPGRYLRYETGTGSRKVMIDTLNGDIDFCMGK